LNAQLEVDEIQFDCVKWTHNASSLILNGESLPITGNMYSPACDVSAPTNALFTLAELEKADVTGKIVIFAGNLSATPLIPLNCKVYNADRDQSINRLLAEKQPAAVIAVNPNPPSMESTIHDADLMVPSATVPAGVGLKLIENPEADVRLKINAVREPGRSTTIIGKKPGPHNKRITLMAHFDSTVNSPGAWDNASGMSALLSLVDRLTNLDLEVDLEFIAFGDHEYYAYSDIFYVEKHGHQMKDILVAINFDGIGQRLGSNNIALMTASEPLQQQVEQEVNDYPGVVWTEPWPESNHSTFAWRGVPSIAFCTDGMRGIHHQPTDTLKWMSEAKIVEVVSLAEDIVKSIQSETVAWSRQSPA
jgi:aminopeptidase YwaD